MLCCLPPIWESGLILSFSGPSVVLSFSLLFGEGAEGLSVVTRAKKDYSLRFNLESNFKKNLLI